MWEQSLTMDRDEDEGGCITEVDVRVQSGDGCILHVRASDTYLGATSEGRLTITYLTFSADSFCPDFPDIDEGLYSGLSGLSVAEVVLGRTGISRFSRLAGGGSLR